MPSGRDTRPTTDRVREALFSALATWFGGAGGPAEEQLDGLAVLDLFAGSGALGLEAASRGALRVVFVERDRAAAGVIRRNIAATHLPGEVVTGSVSVFLDRQSHAAFDLLLLDPPYALPNDELVELLDRVDLNGVIAADGLVVVERDSRTPEPSWPTGLRRERMRRYGETCLYFCRPSESEHDA